MPGISRIHMHISAHFAHERSAIESNYWTRLNSGHLMNPPLSKPERKLHLQERSRWPTRRTRHVVRASPDKPKAQIPNTKAATVTKLKRPDPTILNESIPLFFIGKNSAGLWVARESEGRTGGIFLLKSSAISFAKRESMPGGCALSFVPDGLELDIAPKADERRAG
jgi:hypothetical protein